ncbi:MAG: thiamine pyrophosphate-dependent dehydrogenase E1 component subunit alpha [Chloroflexi bacterium]|nr:thiamine pyrophosphate-dependent dehydrogenase E1 component subunit alpha [Chloroflexota bacterium]MDA8219298.1 thiamine pyrophosphate-dependent dehydrogenase E1 component subunit alpha [Dehalococcoidales bacterium]
MLSLNLSTEDLLGMYRQMCLIREFEYGVLDCIKRGLIMGGPHLYVGEEAIAVGVCSTLRPSDYITSTHRGHGHCIAKGGQLKPMMAELFTKATGYCKGKGGTMHIADMDLGILGANGIVGAGLPIAVGAALSGRLKGKDWVVACFFGDGASNTGAFHEALNLAAVWKLPVLFICENNGYGMFSPLRMTTSVADVAERAHSYDIPGIVVDGNDVLAVREAALAAVGRARAGEGPTLIECKTYRHLGHFVGDPAVYRDDDEVAAWMRRDPIVRFRQFLVERALLAEDADRELRTEIQAEVEQAEAFALESPEPDPTELKADVYAPLKPVGAGL